MWPEWGLWMQKLHHSSFLSKDRWLNNIEGDKWYSIYMKAKSGMSLHYFWLLYMIEMNNGFNNQIDELDKYDD